MNYFHRLHHLLVPGPWPKCRWCGPEDMPIARYKSKGSSLLGIGHGIKGKEEADYFINALLGETKVRLRK